MATKTIELVIAPKTPHFVGDGFRVHNFIPSVYELSMERMDPFILMDYNSKYNFPASSIPKGVGVHPHRGFETVTIAYQGKVEHHDSSGGGGIIDQGDVQWMTAASGVLHKEYHEREWSKNGGLFQMVQLWVNLPAKYKMSAPKYQAIENASIPKYELDNNNGLVEIIAGEYKNMKGAASTFTPINMLNVKAKKDALVEFTFPKNFNTVLLVIEGEIEINNNKSVKTDHLALMRNDGEDFNFKVKEDAIVLVLSGKPINEPIAAHGPFVMNTRQELVQAFNDFNQGKFGELTD